MSNSRDMPDVVRMVLRVKVARWSRSPRNDRTSVPDALCFFAALALALSERTAGATGLSLIGGSSSVKVSGASASRRCHTR